MIKTIKERVRKLKKYFISPSRFEKEISRTPKNEKQV